MSNQGLVAELGRKSFAELKSPAGKVTHHQRTAEKIHAYKLTFAGRSWEAPVRVLAFERGRLAYRAEALPAWAAAVDTPGARA